MTETRRWDDSQHLLTTSLVAPHRVLQLSFNVKLSPSFFSTLGHPAIILHRITQTLFPPGDNETKIAIEKSRRKGH